MSTVKTAIRARVSMTLNRCAETNASYGRTRHWRLEILSCPAFPALCSAIVVEKASTRSGMITIVLCQYLLIGSAREDYIKKQGELYFGINTVDMVIRQRSSFSGKQRQDATTF